MGNSHNERDGNLGTRRGRDAPNERDEGDRPTLPKEGAGRGGVGGRLTTGTGKRVRREETERAKGEGTVRRTMKRKEAARLYLLQMAAFKWAVAGEAA